MTGNWKLGLTFALITVLMWGLLPLILSSVLAVMDPLTITWYRFSISAAIALAWYGHSSGGALRRLLSRGNIGWSALAVLGLVGNYVLYIWGLDYTNPGAAQILIQLAPLLLLVASVLVLGEEFRRLQWLGVVTFSLGMLLFFHRRLGDSVETGSGYVLGAAMLVGGAVVWTAYGLAQKKLLGAFHAKDILLLICLGGSALLLPLASPASALGLDAPDLLMLLFCGINTIVAYGAFGLALSHWEASRVSAIVPLAPLLTLLFTWALNAAFGLDIPEEPLDWLGGLGAVLVVAGSGLAALPGRR
ncbi:MAG: DMT family transporter [Halioglobus sp.]|nr:DMT family transporter [Halioglobus sp.]